MASPELEKQELEKQMAKWIQKGVRSRVKAAEIVACSQPAPLRERLSLNHQAFSEFAEKQIEQLTKENEQKTKKIELLEQELAALRGEKRS